MVSPCVNVTIVLQSVMFYHRRAMYTKLFAIVAVCALSALTSCVSPSSSGPSGPGSCHRAVDTMWPASSRSWAHKIVQRESGGNPTAKNRSSSASGCFQMLSIHAPRFSKLGYSWSNDRFRADAGVRVALDLYNEQGQGPWRF